VVNKENKMRTSDEKVHYYSKTVEVSDTAMVIASVHAHAEDGHCLRRVGVSFFLWNFNTLETRAKKAHKWADKRILECKAYECQKLKS
jgi:hypothetical protein